MSSLTAYFIKRFTAGEACFTDGSIMPSVIFSGGETGTFATSHIQPFTISSFVRLMPSPFSTSAHAEKLSLV